MLCYHNSNLLLGLQFENYTFRDMVCFAADPTPIRALFIALHFLRMRVSLDNSS